MTTGLQPGAGIHPGSPQTRSRGPGLGSQLHAGPHKEALAARMATVTTPWGRRAGDDGMDTAMLPPPPLGSGMGFDGKPPALTKRPFLLFSPERREVNPRVWREAWWCIYFSPSPPPCTEDLAAQVCPGPQDSQQGHGDSSSLMEKPDSQRPA